MTTLLDGTHYIPLATTAFALWFAPQLFGRWAERRPSPHLFWWGLGVALYGLGTLTESLTTLLGWHEGVFRLWYISGALLGGAPLAQGSAYLLLSRPKADRIAGILVTVVAIAAVCVLLSPVDPARIEAHRLSGHVLTWSWVRAFSPFINTYAFLMLVGGAVASAWRFARQPGMTHRTLANVYIAIGGLLPGIGGTFTRFGHVEVLYVTEFLGLVLIYIGYRTAVEGRPATAAAQAA
ncbi:MAG TPA: hypothetical protein VG940_06515 [Gemmatimonadales bacterium]|nr:hypothetical protein [Gemmatimonadales bacterium]